MQPDKHSGMLCAAAYVPVTAHLKAISAQQHAAALACPHLKVATLLLPLCAHMQAKRHAQVEGHVAHFLYDAADVVAHMHKCAARC